MHCACRGFGRTPVHPCVEVQQLCRDAKVLQIYAGTDEIQIRAIAKELLAGG